MPPSSLRPFVPLSLHRYVPPSLPNKMLRRIDRLILRVPGLESAVRYYRDVLGMTLIRHDAHLASFRLGEGPAELILHDDPDQPADAVYFLVDDVRDLYARRDELKLKFMSPP